MGQRGPSPTPTAIKALRGNPGRRPLPANEPQATVAEPYRPAHLDDDAIAEWNRIVPLLLAMRVLTEADYLSLANLCQAYSTLVKAQKKLNATGLLVKAPSGYPMQSPLITIINQNTDIVTKLCREFGLTPSARSRVQALPEQKSKEYDPWDRL